VRKATLASILRESRPGMRLNEHLEHDCGLTVFQHACKARLTLPFRPLAGLAQVQENAPIRWAGSASRSLLPLTWDGEVAKMNNGKSPVKAARHAVWSVVQSEAGAAGWWAELNWDDGRQDRVLRFNSKEEAEAWLRWRDDDAHHASRSR
jgi:hypothetical protein